MATNAYTGSQIELKKMLDHFGDQEFIDAHLSTKKQHLVLLATFVTTMAYPQIKEQTGLALDAGLTPVEIREAIYQTAPYAGFQKALNAMAYADEMFAERGIGLPLESTAAVSDENRYELGLKVQRSIFGANFGELTEDMTAFERRRMAFVSEFSFGDFMTRGGLDKAERELIITSVIAVLGEPQLAGHVNGAIVAGNKPDELRAAVLMNMQYLGFPRGLNAYDTVDSVIKSRQ